jgi:hypothetical protein
VKHSSSGYGAIAQLGERVLCKHEVVGSIPSGSTSLRWLRQLRLGEPIVAKPIVAKPIVAKPIVAKAAAS